MPAVSIECCGRVMSLDEALAHVEQRDNRCEWTHELLSAMFAAQAAHPSSRDASRISTTVLTTKCLRRVTLERHLPYTVKPADLWATFRGTMFHKQLEAWAHPQSYGEARFHVADLGVQIPSVARALPGADVDRSFSGSPDLVDPLRGNLYDYKRTKEVPRFNYPWPDHVAQNNINRWLVDHADTVELRYTLRDGDDYAALIRDYGDGLGTVCKAEWNEPDYPAGLISARFDVDEPSDAVIATWDLAHPDVRRRFVPVDWQSLIVVYADDKGPKPIVCTESVRVPAKRGGTKNARVPEIWSDDKVEHYIAERYVLARKALDSQLAPIPPGWERQSHVLCGYCPVRSTCAGLEFQDALTEALANGQIQ